MNAYQWLICYLLKRSWEKVNSQIKTGKLEFWARSDSQVYYSKTLAIMYIQVKFMSFYLTVLVMTC